jgi:hypothetical protein
MIHPESAAGVESAFDWKSYAVSRSDKAPLLKFITDALEMRGCIIVYASGAERAPFYIVFDTAGGERLAVLAYAFLANARVTRNRPPDEHRFQIKYGSRLKGVLDVGLDPRQAITTIFVGIDPERRLFVAADPVMNNPSPMSRSIEFKAGDAEEIFARGWWTWERARNPPRTRDRPTAAFDEDLRVQVLIGGVQERLLDLVRLERLGRGLDTGDRHLLADKLGAEREEVAGKLTSHRLLQELQLPGDALFDLIDGASRLKMAVRGWVAEVKLVEALRATSGVSECRRIEGEGQPDVSLRWKGGAPFFIECKNVLRKRSGAGVPRVDFQRTRASKEDPCSRYYRPSDFSVLAACLHSVTEDWAFEFAVTDELPPHNSCPGRIANNIQVTAPLFTNRPELVFAKCSGPS